MFASTRSSDKQLAKADDRVKAKSLRWLPVKNTVDSAVMCGNIAQIRLYLSRGELPSEGAVKQLLKDSNIETIRALFILGMCPTDAMVSQINRVKHTRRHKLLAIMLDHGYEPNSHLLTRTLLAAPLNHRSLELLQKRDIQLVVAANIPTNHWWLDYLKIILKKRPVISTCNGISLLKLAKDNKRDDVVSVIEQSGLKALFEEADRNKPRWG